jgi:hypothetical protein
MQRTLTFYKIEITGMNDELVCCLLERHEKKLEDTSLSIYRKREQCGRHVFTTLLYGFNADCPYVDANRKEIEGKLVAAVVIEETRRLCLCWSNTHKMNRIVEAINSTVGKAEDIKFKLDEIRDANFEECLDDPGARFTIIAAPVTPEDNLFDIEAARDKKRAVESYMANSIKHSPPEWIQSEVQFKSKRWITGEEMRAFLAWRQSLDEEGGINPINVVSVKYSGTFRSKTFKNALLNNLSSKKTTMEISEPTIEGIMAMLKGEIIDYIEKDSE